MTDEPMDMADHLITATRLASREGLTKEQYLHAASVFWNSWHEVQAVMRDTPTHRNSDRGETE